MRTLSILLSLTTIYSTVSLEAPPSRPHIILIVADDLGYNDVSFHGSDQIPTPNIDYLGQTGIVLNNYYVSPICTPTRSALMTGRHPIHTGMQHGVISGDEPFGLSLNETLMSQHLNELGYRSHIVGKWHLGMFQWQYTPLYRGFESHLGYFMGRNDYYDHTYEWNASQWGLDFRKNLQAAWNYTGQYSTDLFREEAKSIIKSHNTSEPLFLYLPFQAVHSGNKNAFSLQAPQTYIDRFSYIENYQRRVYAAMMSALDDAVGDIYDTLQSSKLFSNSILIFTTDNGGPANGFDNNAASNFPLRGAKASLWEGGVRGVGLVHSPLLKTFGYVSEQMVHVCDWLPTLYRAAGGDPSTLKNVDGFDLWQMLNENSESVRSEILHNIDPIDYGAAIRVDDFKLLTGHVSRKGMDGWYPPYQLAEDNVNLHFENYRDNFKEPEMTTKLREKLQQGYRKSWNTDILHRMESLSSKHNDGIEGDLNAHHYDSNREDGKLTLGVSVSVSCGYKPENASTSCNPKKHPCLFNIREDPCEYHNIAAAHPDIVEKLLARIKIYQDSMVPPRNQPCDDAGNPSHHGGVWEPWKN